MTPAHTPGPWHYYAGSHSVGSLSSERSVCIVSGPRSILDPERIAEQNANACLIAAAPDLLAAIKQLMAAYESVLPGLAKIAVPDYALINDAPVAAERAILRAEGRDA